MESPCLKIRQVNLQYNTNEMCIRDRFYTAFGSILKRDYSLGDMIDVDGLHETVERLVQVDIETFEEKYGDYLNQEQLARAFRCV